MICIITTNVKGLWRDHGELCMFKTAVFYYSTTFWEDLQENEVAKVSHIRIVQYYPLTEY